jgi:hypothetical protein
MYDARQPQRIIAAVAGDIVLLLDQHRLQFLLRHAHIRSA